MRKIRTLHQREPFEISLQHGVSCPSLALAVVIGVVSAYVAVALLKLINFFTNLFFFQRLSDAPASPGNSHLGLWLLAVPVIGGLIVGLIARFGSDKIRGHGIPEAIEAILLRGAKVEPKLALLKPVSAAIAIGSGGPFGAEGPIIMTGGAFGSLIAQFFHLTSAERKTLLVAGAAAGMSATFAAPFASILLAIELLLFEWKPRSFIPVALASVTAEAARVHLLGAGSRISRAAPRRGIQPRNSLWLPARWDIERGPVFSPDPARLCRGRCLCAPQKNSLDVVACNRERGRRYWRVSVPARFGRGI